MGKNINKRAPRIHTRDYLGVQHIPSTPGNCDTNCITLFIKKLKMFKTIVKFHYAKISYFEVLG